MKYDILEEETVFDHFFKIKKAKIRHELFDSNSIEIERLCFERGDSVAILIYEKDTDSLLFTNQFRYPTAKKENGWILELTAGSIESDDDDPKERAKKEIEEEIGYQVDELEFIRSFFVSPGGTSERIMLFYSEVNSTHKIYDGRGMKFESEDIQLVKIKTSEVSERLKKNEFRDAKTLVGIQWFLLNKK